MKKYLENRISMLYAVKQACETHTATWTPLVPYAAAHGDFIARLTRIEDKIETQELQLGGITEDKRVHKEAMVDATLLVAQASYALATATNDVDLKGKMDYSRSDLLRGRDTVIGQRCQGVHTEANAVAAALVPYGVTAATLTALQTAIDDYVALVSAPRTAVTIRKGATEAIAQYVGECLDILHDRMDKLMILFKTTAPGFHQEYMDARIIVDLGGTGDNEEEPTPPTP